MKISIRSTTVLATIAVISIALLVLVEQTKKNVKEEWYNEKIAASKLTARAFKHLKDVQYKNVEFIDNINDPNETGLIGEQYTQITTGNGSLPIKASTMNPNFGALMVQLLKDAKVKKGDVVGVCLTGSFPGLNIAMLAAMQTLGVKPIIINSVTASSWGANDPDFTFPDMLSSLNKASIFNAKITAASMGGNLDIGRALSIEGREMVEAAIQRNHLKYINTGSLKGNIQERLNIFKKENKGRKLKAFINIGGGVASNGSNINGDLIKAGVHKELKLKNFPDKYGVMYEMAKMQTTIIHLKNVITLMNKYKLPFEPVPIPAIGEGKLFFSYKYQVWIVSLSFIFLVSILVATMIIDKKQHALGNEILKNEN
jgi:poly-gamma-glutamate system protein